MSSITLHTLVSYQGKDFADPYGQQVLKVLQIERSLAQCQLADGSTSEWIPLSDLTPLVSLHSDRPPYDVEEDFSWDPPLDAPICYALE